MVLRTGLILAFILLAGPPSAAASGLRALFPDGAALPGITLQSFDLYDADTLWERINGEAEIHRSYGLLEAAYGLYGDGGEDGRTLQIALFRMPDSLSAFGLYSSYRPRDGGGQMLGNGAVTEDFQAFLWHGSFFAALEAFGPREFTAPALAAGLEALVSALGEPPPPPRSLVALSRFVDRGTIIYRPGHLLGREALPPGLEGQATAGTVMFIATERAVAEEILAAYGGTIENSAVARDGGSTLLRGSDPDRGPVAILFRDDHLAGSLHGEKSAPAAGELEALLEALNETD